MWLEHSNYYFVFLSEMIKLLLTLWMPSAYIHAFSHNHRIICVMHVSVVTAPQYLVCRAVPSLHINHMQMSIIEVFICRRLHMNTSMILICIWLICRLGTTLHTKCCGAVCVYYKESLWIPCCTFTYMQFSDYSCNKLYFLWTGDGVNWHFKHVMWDTHSCSGSK